MATAMSWRRQGRCEGREGGKALRDRSGGGAVGCALLE